MYTVLLILLLGSNNFRAREYSQHQLAQQHRTPLLAYWEDDDIERMTRIRILQRRLQILEDERNIAKYYGYPMLSYIANPWPLTGGEYVNLRADWWEEIWGENLQPQERRQ